MSAFTLILDAVAVILLDDRMAWYVVKALRLETIRMDEPATKFVPQGCRAFRSTPHEIGN